MSEFISQMCVQSPCNQFHPTHFPIPLHMPVFLAHRFCRNQNISLSQPQLPLRSLHHRVLCTATVKYRKQSSLNLNFVLDLQFECWDDERIQFCQQYQLPHSSLIERHFEVLMLQIRGNSETSASDMSFKCPPCPLSKQCTFQTEETRK